MARKKVTSLQTERQKRGQPLEPWRSGIYALLVTKPKAGKVVRLRKKPPPAS